MRTHIRVLLPAALLLIAPMLHAETVTGILMDKMCSGMPVCGWWNVTR